MEYIDICTPGGTLYVLDKFGIKARKKYGQNFLIDSNIVRKIISAAGITKDDCVLEIGPGIGTMTGMLSEAAGHVVAVEIDESLRPVLTETLAGRDNIDIIWNDVLKTDLREIADRHNGGRPMKVVANLPYYVTTPIIMKLLKEKGCFDSITVMVQKEVAERICSAPGNKNYGAITLAVKYYSEPEVVTDVSPNCFIPRPGVTSSVLCLKARDEAPVSADEQFLFAVIRASFNQRRKTIANGIVSGLEHDDTDKNITREDVQKCLSEMGLKEDVRGEKLSLEEFAELSEKLRNMR